MSERRRRRGKDGRRRGKEFMDAAMDAYIRHVALQKWREVTDVQEALGLDAAGAAREVGNFPERGAYRGVWERCWQREVVASIAAPMASRFGHIEMAVQRALGEEVEARQQCGDTPIEDSSDYKAFLDHTLDRLFEEEAGSLEEL